MPINPSQKIPSASRGKLLSADMVNTIVAAMKRMVVGGDGIRVEVMGDQIRINAKRQLIPVGRGGGGDTLWCKTATTKAGLEEPVGEIYFGRVTAGTDQGMMCVRNPDNDGWNAFTHFE